MKGLPRNVWLLAMAQALMMTVNSTVVFVGGIIGSDLAPTENLATLPVAAIIVGTAATIVPVTWIMKKIGRKRSFLIILVFSVLISFLAVYALTLGSFLLFVAAAFLFGITSATILQFRFAAMESVDPSQHAQAASVVLIGGIAAAYIGPELALAGQHLYATPFLGSFVLLAVMFLLSLLILIPYENSIPDQEETQGRIRTLWKISQQDAFWVAVLAAAIGYAVMSFIMTATPISMHKMDGHSLEHTKWVIQSHIMAMYLPSLVIGKIIEKIGHKKVMLAGLLAYMLCMALAFASHELLNYWSALVMLGIGWNFLFIGGTALLPNTYRPEERFKVQAFNEFIVFGSQALAALSAGWIVFSFGWQVMLLASLPFIFFMSVLLFRWNPNRHRNE